MTDTDKQPDDVVDMDETSKSAEVLEETDVEDEGEKEPDASIKDDE